MAKEQSGTVVDVRFDLIVAAAACRAGSMSIIPAVPKLPTAEARGAIGLAAIKEPRAICVTPTSWASFCAPSFLRSRAVSALAVTRGSAVPG